MKPETSNDTAMTRSNKHITFRTILKINMVFWSIWLFFYAFLVFGQVPQMPNFAVALYNSFATVLPLFLLSLLAWPTYQRLDWRKGNRWLVGIAHFVLANVFTVIWLFCSFGIQYLAVGDELFNIINVYEIAGWQYPEGILFYLMVNGVYATLLFYHEVKERELRESRLLLSLKDAEWSALKAQLNPHFLFNALNSISALITSDPQKARLMLVKLSELLRRALTENPEQTIHLEQELAFLHQYLELERIRLQDRLHYEEHIDPQLEDSQIPVMLLQPLVENAVKHGISQSVRGGWIKLDMQQRDYKIIGTITNSIPEDYVADGNQQDGTATGLINLKRRLDLLYDDQMAFSAQLSDDGKSYQVNFQLPRAVENQ